MKDLHAYAATNKSIAAHSSELCRSEDDNDRRKCLSCNDFNQCEHISIWKEMNKLYPEAVLYFREAIQLLPFNSPMALLNISIVNWYVGI